MPGTTVDRQCGSSQQAVHFAAAGLVAGQYDVVVAGGVESMSRVPMGSSRGGQDPMGPQFMARYDGVSPNQGIGAEMIAERWGLSRTQLDEFALRSHERAAAAQDEGRFDAQIAPVDAPDGTVVDPGRGHPPRRHGRGAGRAEDAVQGRRRGHRRQRHPDLRRLGRAADDDQREGRASSA